MQSGWVLSAKRSGLRSRRSVRARAGGMKQRGEKPYDASGIGGNTYTRRDSFLPCFASTKHWFCGKASRLAGCRGPGAGTRDEGEAQNAPAGTGASATETRSDQTFLISSPRPPRRCLASSHQSHLHSRLVLGPLSSSCKVPKTPPQLAPVHGLAKCRVSPRYSRV